MLRYFEIQMIKNLRPSKKYLRFTVKAKARTRVGIQINTHRELHIYHTPVMMFL